MDDEVTTASGESEPTAQSRPVSVLDEQIRSIQPAGGVCMSVELAWGRLRRWYLKRFRPGFVRRMAELRQGNSDGYAQEILDPRDLKFYQNQGSLAWRPEDDPFLWRDRLPFVRVGLAEIVILGGGCLLLAIALYYVFWPAAVVPALLALFILWFFRDPRREVPTEAGTVVAPADGRVFSVRDEEFDELIGGPAVVIDIFLSVFNVHVNRVPVDCRVIGIHYRPGKCLNALRAEAARLNEALELQIEETAETRRAMRVRQITGAIARRIVCWVKPGEHLSKGMRFGMIKLGSRTELTLPREPGMELLTAVGQRVRAGTTVVARYPQD
jgi:phosphatidylserine decarboxylase